MELKFVATDRKGKKISSTATADSVGALINRLKRDGLQPIKVYEAKPARVRVGVLRAIFSHRAVKSKEVVIFTRQLAATLSAGLLLTEALETIGEDLENDYFRRMIKKIIVDIQAGLDFSTAISKYPKVFPLTYVSIVRSGEATGNLHLTMTDLAKYMENFERMKEKAKSAIRYPMFIFGFAILVVSVIVLFIIPKFTAMFDDAGAQLPFITRAVVAVSDFALANAMLMIGGFGVLLFLFFFSLRFDRVRYVVDTIKIRLPIVGKAIIQKVMVSRFCRPLSVLLGGGVGLAKSLEITSQVVDHLPMRKAVEDVRNHVLAGSSISEELKKKKMFPRLVSKMVSVGEKTGNIGDMLKRTSDYYDEEVDISLQNLTALLEPVLIIFVGGMILIVVLALYLPIFNLSSAIR